MPLRDDTNHGDRSKPGGPPAAATASRHAAPGQAEMRDPCGSCREAVRVPPAPQHRRRAGRTTRAACLAPPPPPPPPVIRPREMIRSLVPSPSSEDELCYVADVAHYMYTARLVQHLHLQQPVPGSEYMLGSKSAHRRGPSVRPSSRLLAVRVPGACLPLAFAAWRQLLVRSRWLPSIHPTRAAMPTDRDLVCGPIRSIQSKSSLDRTGMEKEGGGDGGSRRASALCSGA